ncbi:elongation factor G, partial [Mycoplasmopsis synoviae]
LAYKIAVSKALTKAKDLIVTVLLEPIMDVSVVVPSDHMGDVIGDLSRRRGLISDQEQRNDGAVIVRPKVPLSEMFGYSTELRSMSSRHGTYQMQFDHYEKCPKNIS